MFPPNTRISSILSSWTIFWIAKSVAFASRSPVRKKREAYTRTSDHGFKNFGVGEHGA